MTITASKKSPALIVLLAFICLLGHGVAMSQTELTYDGLKRVTDTKMDEAWVREGFDPSDYSKIMFRGAGIHYLPAKRRSGTRIGSQTRFPVDAKSRSQLEEIVTEEFRKQLVEVSAFEVVDEPGPDTLLLVVSLIDVASHVPTNLMGRHEVYLSEVGTATLVLEFRDSESGAILVRGADRRAAKRYGDEFTRANPVTTWPVVKRLAATWAKGLRKGIDGMVKPAP